MLHKTWFWVILSVVIIGVLLIHALCVEYCLESWTGKDWLLWECFLIGFIPGAQASPIAAFVTWIIIY